MTAPYLLRLLCISLASFFLIHLAIGLLLMLFSPALVRLAERLRPRRAAALLLALRLLPATLAFSVVSGLCVPSYLWLEPRSTSEELGWACVGAAFLAAACFTAALLRSWRAASRSSGYIRYCQLVGRQTCLGADASPAWVVEGPTPFLALAGIVRPRLMISRDVVTALSAEQLSAALRHEHAHRVSADNLKRLLVLLAPDVLPFWRSFDCLERGWARVTEWAADDRAAAGDSQRSISLAAALVRVARLGACPQAPPLVTSLLADNEDLAQRVDRLLREAPVDRPGHAAPVLAAGAGLAVCISLAVWISQPATLYRVHGLLEHLTH